MESCLLNASGPGSITKEQILKLNEIPEVGAIVTKSFTLNEFEGNPEPVKYYTNEYSVNSVGLRNYGFEYYKEIIEFCEFKKPIYLSVAETNMTRLIYMLREIEQAKKGNNKVYIEYNFGCPNRSATINGVSTLGYSMVALRDYVVTLNEVCKLTPFGVKLPPYLDHGILQEVGNTLKNCEGLKFVTVCNTLGNSYVPEARLSMDYGGLGGTKSLKFIAMGNIKQLKKILGDSVTIIGCGGVTSGVDICDFKEVGADLVQIGTTYFKNGTEEFSRIYYEYYKNICN